MARISIVVFASALLLAAASAHAACGGSALCGPSDNPCNVAANCTVNNGAIFDLGDRDLVIKTGKTLTIAGGTSDTSITAGSLTLEAGAKIFVTQGPSPDNIGATLSVAVNRGITLLTSGSSKAAIQAFGGASGGFLDLSAAGDINVNGFLDVHATDTDGLGGNLSLRSIGGTLTLTGAGVDAHGGSNADLGGGGGFIELESAGNLVLDAPLAATKGDGAGAEIDLTSDNGDITTTANGTVDTSASTTVAGDGGLITFTAAGTVSLGGAVSANAGGYGGYLDGDSGSGGEVDILAGADAHVLAPVTALGAFPYGDGGTITADVGGYLEIAKSISAYSINSNLSNPAYAFGGTMDLHGASVDVKATLDASGGIQGDDITGVSVNADTTLHVFPGVVLASNGTDYGGVVELGACSVTVDKGAQLQAQQLQPSAPGIPPTGQIDLQGGTVVNVDGKLRGAAQNLVERRSTGSIVLGPDLDAVPAVVQAVNDTLTCCGVGCTTTTTTAPSTTTTTTTTAPSTTSTTVPTTTSTTAPSTTTSTSTTTTSTFLATTTTSTVPSTTTTSTTSTTTTSSTSTTTSTSTTSTSTPTSTTSSTSTSTSTTTVEPTTSTTTTEASTTTTTPAPSTTTTTLPLSCLEQGLTGFDDVYCQLDTVNDTLTTSADTSLGGTRWAKRLRKLYAKARTQVDAANATGKRKAYKRANVALHALQANIKRAGKHGMPADVRDGLLGLTGDVQSELGALRS